jgi:integrase
VLRRADRVRYDEVAADLRRHYETTGERDLDEADGRLAHLKRFFTGRRIASIGPADVTTYAQRRQLDGAANGTINRELAVLARMLRIAYKANKLARLPVIEKLKEAGARQGFLEPEQYEAVRRRLAPDLQTALTIAYAFGWRMQSEVLTLERRQLDLKAGTLRLDPGTTKNDEGRIVTSPPSSRRSWRPRWSAWRPSRSDSAALCPSCSPTSPTASGSGSARVSGGATSGRPGRRPAGRLVCRGCCATTAGVARSATW